MSENTKAKTEAADLATLRNELRSKKQEAKVAEKLAQWEEKTAKRNPQYVVGSVRKATEKDAEILGHSHGEVCLIRCQECDKTRVINKQDAFQVRFCQDCRKIARRKTAKDRRQAKLDSPETIQAEIAKLQEQLAALGQAKPAKKARKAS